jgi:hypothetical protein
MAQRYPNIMDLTSLTPAAALKDRRGRITAQMQQIHYLGKGRTPIPDSKTTRGRLNY